MMGTAVLFAAAAFLFALRVSVAADKPNIVLIVWDTCRGDRVSVNGYLRHTTPRLTELAAEGVVFRNAFTPSPWTPPAHASLFTGVLPKDHGLREGMGESLTSKIPLLAETLAKSGYETVCFTANPLISGVTGLNAGFQQEFACYRSDDGTVTGEAVREQVKAWVTFRKQSGGAKRPLFLFINLMDTHLPYVFDGKAVAEIHGETMVEGARRAATQVGDFEAKAHLLGRHRIPDATIADLSRAYDGAVRRTDALTGGMLDVLRAEGVVDADAFVAVCGDHGENLGEHGELNHALSVHDPVLRVPMVVRWPGRLEPGRVEDAQVRLQDLYASILEVAQVDVPPGNGTHSRTLGESPLTPRPLIAEFGPMPRSMEAARGALPGAPPDLFERFLHKYRAVQVEDGRRRWKLITVFEAPDTRHERIVREELYDLGSDPGELRNLLAGTPDADALLVAERLRGVSK
jgi:arylsulfatase A-like enzyme